MSKAQAYAEKMGVWVGPIGAGRFSVFPGAFWDRVLIDRGPPRSRGAGILVALVDVALLAAMQAPFQWLLVVSGVAKVVAGTAGGWCAVRSA